MQSATIDGVLVPLGSIYFLVQDDPFPGGHTYEIQFEDPELSASLRSRFGKQIPDTFERREIDWVFSELRIATTRYRAAADVKFFANNIIRMAFDNNTTIITGICSPVMTNESGQQVGQPERR